MNTDEMFWLISSQTKDSLLYTCVVQKIKAELIRKLASISSRVGMQIGEGEGPLIRLLNSEKARLPGHAA